jgi:glycosyltransferase involved in cell wall biosynthesis
MDNCVQYGIYPWENYLNLEKKCSQNSLIPFFSVKQKIKNFLSTSVFFDYVDLWSIEDDESRAYYSKQYKFFRNKLITVYNGHTVDLEMPRHIKSLNEKDDIILTVGRLGTYQKATEILLEAYSVVAANSDFNLHLAGQIENKFQQEVYEYFNKYPNLQDRVVFHGPLEKDPLFELYNRSKIFCLPSRYETFALVFGEAMFFKNAIVTTHNVSPSCIVKDQMGLLVEKDDPIGLANAILDLIRHPEKLEQYSESAHLFAVNELNWDKIVVKLNDEIDGKLSHNQ